MASVRAAVEKLLVLWITLIPAIYFAGMRDSLCERWPVLEIAGVRDAWYNNHWYYE